MGSQRKSRGLYVQISEDTLRYAKAAAALRGNTLKEIVEHALRSFVIKAGINNFGEVEEVVKRKPKR